VSFLFKTGVIQKPAFLRRSIVKQQWPVFFRYGVRFMTFSREKKFQKHFRKKPKTSPVKNRDDFPTPESRKRGQE